MLTNRIKLFANRLVALDKRYRTPAGLRRKRSVPVSELSETLNVPLTDAAWNLWMA